MGRWGERFFEGDNDLDEASMMSEDAGIELYHYEIDEKEDPDWPFSGKGLEATRDHPNTGVLSRLFKEYSTTERSRRVLSWLCASEQLLSLPICKLLRDSYPKIHVSPKYSFVLSDSGFRAPMKEQFEIALAHYKNDGTPFDFGAVRCENMECGKDRSDLEEGKELKKCGKCQDVFYCSKECQAKDWAKHKKGCMTPEKRAAKAKQHPSPFGAFSMNV